MNSIEPLYKRCITSIDDVQQAVALAPGLTSAELAERLRMLDVSFPEYLIAAQETGKIKVGPPRQCTVRKRLCTTWWPAQ